MAKARKDDLNSSSSTSSSMIAGMRADDAAAWERFTRLYSALMDHWFRQARIPPGEWADLRQEVFLTVSRSLPNYRHETGRAAFRNWLRVIARNKWIDRCRERFPVVDSELLAMVSVPADTEGSAKQQMFLRQALHLIQTDFEPATWQAFWRVVVEHGDAAETAASLGMTLNAVYLAKARVIRRLRLEFADFLDEDHTPPPVK